MFFFVSGHVFLQQPCHPTYFALERLDQCMSNTYSQFNCPAVSLIFVDKVSVKCVKKCPLMVPFWDIWYGNAIFEGHKIVLNDCKSCDQLKWEDCNIT